MMQHKESRQLPVDSNVDIELTSFRESPKFPRQRPEPERDQSEDDDNDRGTSPYPVSESLFTVPTDEEDIRSPSPPPYRLQPLQPDILIRTRSPFSKSLTSGRSSPTVTSRSGKDHSSRSTSVSVATKGSTKKKLVDIKTSRGKHFTIDPKDASILDRISHKAPKRTRRVREAHEVFVELEELRFGESDEFEWEETARWIKFEEDVEQEVGRWGRPHLSALAFHSLVDLRSGLHRGCVLLDVEGDNFPAIVDKIVENLVENDYLPQDKVDFVLQALYKKHKHQHQVTLWDDLKQAAKSADGKLHDIGDQLRHRYHHHSMNSEGKLRSSFRKTLVTNEDQQDADELQENNNNTQNLNHVTFAVRRSNESVNKQVEVEIEEIDTDNDIKEEEVTLDNHHLHPSAHSLTSLGDDNHKLSRSVQDLLHKIPDDAESLTVLVGGVPFLTEPLVVFVRLKQSHLLGDLTEVPVPVRFIYLNIGPTNYMDYHEVGRAMATLMSDKCFHETAYSSLSKDEIMDAIDQFLDDSIVLPPGDWDPELILPIMHERNEQKLKKEKIKEHHLQHHEKEEEVKFSCKPCGGFVHDLKNLIRRYPSDIKDVFHIQAFLAIFFIYISCVAPAVAFGGLMEELSGTELGVTETLVGTGLCGIIYGLFSVQPLAILAFTGPLLLFEEIVLEFSHLLHIEYLSWRAWIGLWVMLFVILFSVFELTFLIKNFTRFSEEIFTGVIALFFTIEAVRTIVRIFERNPICGINAPCGIFVNCTDLCDCSSSNMTLNDSSGSGMMTMTMDENVTMEEPSLPHDFLICNQPNTALWSVFLCISVFVVAVILRKIRHGRFLSKQVRRLVSDFGMFTALLTLGLLAYFLRNTIAIEIIVVPNGWLPTNSSLRGWIINPLKNLEFYHIIGAIIPAFLLAVLICIENQLALFLIEKPEHELKKKGAGYHLDLCIVGVLTGICSIMGLPWHCAASIRSIQHLQALSYYSRRMAPGEKPQLAGVYEQRITNIAIHTLIILTPFAFPVLQQIPMSMLMGVFLYLAYASFSGIQLRKRIKLFFMPSKHHPDIHYVRKVKTWKMNLYTFIQVVCAGILIGLKNSPAGMLYPLVIVLMVPLRMFLGKFVYNQSEFEALNNEEDFPDEVDDDYSFTEFEITHVPY